jgi:hypothetical protein
VQVSAYVIVPSAHHYSFLHSFPHLFNYVMDVYCQPLGHAGQNARLINQLLVKLTLGFGSQTNRSTSLTDHQQMKQV